MQHAAASSNQDNTTSSSETNQQVCDMIKQQWLTTCTSKVQCLLICTAFTFEIWVVNKAISIKLMLNEELDCLFRKQEPDIIYLDFVHINPEYVNKGQAMFEQSEEFK